MGAKHQGRHDSALIQAAQDGDARITAAFGGQGPSNLNCFNDLLELNKTYGSTLRPLIHTADATLSELASLPHSSGFHEDEGFEILEWLEDPAEAPSRDYLALSPMSFPINTLISLCNYCITLRALKLDPSQFRSLLKSVVGHSQGIFAAAAVAKADSWESFLEAADLALQISFWVGLESHTAAPHAQISAAAVQDCIDHGEGQPSSMLGITGLNRAQVEMLVEHVNKSLVDENRHVYLALVNSRDKYTIAGPPQSLRAVCVQLREIRAANGVDQSRTLFNKRKQDVDAQFLPISAPYHSQYLKRVGNHVLDALEVDLLGSELGTPLLHTKSGRNLQDWKSESIVKILVSAVTTDMVEWPNICQQLDSSHILGFGPGNIGYLIHETTEGTGVRVIQMNDRSPGSRGIGARAELFSDEMPPQALDWREAFGPKLVLDHRGDVQIQTKMTQLLNAPPVMVAGMTPTTVPWDFVSCVMQAGYHVELAGGGYSSEPYFERALRKLAASIPIYRGITCNLLYASPQTIAWQVDVLRRLVKEGISVEGVAIGAGIPSPDVVKGYIESIGLKHISFKPGSSAAIDEVIETAQAHPHFPIGLQWTGGRAGGHHSFEDFHLPILKAYPRIRRCANIVLIAGSGFGGGSDTWPYISGDWSKSFGYAPMPFDGVLLGSRMMVAKEAHTSPQAKQLIIQTEGVDDNDWHSSFDAPTGGVITITSEHGQPIHMLATRGVMLWKEFDKRIFSIKDTNKRLSYLRTHREEIITRLNKDYQKPWFGVDGNGQNVDLDSMSYREVLGRMCQLMSRGDKGWIDPSWLTMVHDFVEIAGERFGCHVDTHATKSSEIRKAFEGALGNDIDDTLYPEDVALVMELFRRRGRKPVPFVPALDENFETWCKKDSLWQSEDVDSLVGKDVQRACIIQGPVAVRQSIIHDEPVRDILDNICNYHIESLSQAGVTPGSISKQDNGIPRSVKKSVPGVQISIDKSTVRCEVLKTDRLPPEMDALIEHIVGSAADSWARHCLKDDWIFRDQARLRNPIRTAFLRQIQPGEVIEVRLGRDGQAQAIALKAALFGKSSLQTVLRIASTDGKSIKVALTPPSFLSDKPLGLQFAYQLSRKSRGSKLVEVTPDRLDTIKGFYAQLWTAGTHDVKQSGLSSEFWGEPTTLIAQDVQNYTAVVGRSTSPELQAWNPTGSVPLDYCIVLAWTALTKPLTIPALQCDLLNLLHRSVNFKYATNATPLRLGDVTQTVSRITSLTIQPTGKLVEVSAELCRDEKTVVTITTEFFIVGQFEDYGTQFKSFDEPMLEVHVHSATRQALLQSRKWLILDDPSMDLAGLTLSFNLNTYTMFNNEGKVGALQVAGTVSKVESSGFDTRIGNIYFEEDSCIGNPVIDFLHRHGYLRETRQALENPGWTDGSTVVVKAPIKSNQYAVASKDTNPLHVCDVFARYAGLPGTVVHGMHTSAIVRRTVEWAVNDSDRSRFKKWQVSFEGMVWPNDRIKVQLQHIAMEDGRMVMKVQAHNDETGDKVIEAEAEVEQPRTGYVFCGQGSQEKGMGMLLYHARPEAKALWDRGDKYLRENYGFSLLSLVRENPTTLTINFGGRRGKRIRDNYLAMTKKTSLEKDAKDVCIVQGLTPTSTSYTFSEAKGLLFSTQFSQPALALMEMVEHEHLVAKGVVQPSALFAGHSLGEYAALGACTTFMSFESLLTLIFYRGLKMQNALERDANGRTDYSMMATDPSRVGKGFDERAFQCLVELVNEETGLLMEIVNHNVRSQQYVCAGHFRALWILGKVCDDLAKHPKIHLLSMQDLKDMVTAHVPAATKLTNDVVLMRGKATIPLNGIDIPFHSTMLRGEIEHFRRYLLTKVNVPDIKPKELVLAKQNSSSFPFSLASTMATISAQVLGSLEGYLSFFMPRGNGSSLFRLIFGYSLAAFVIGISSVLLWTLATIFYRLYLHPLRRYPGPKLWAVSRLPYIRSTVKGTIVHDFHKLHQQYGSVVRIAPDELSYSTPDATKVIYQSNPELHKDPMHLPPFHNGTPGILAAEEQHHRRYRRLLAYGFSDRGMRAQQPLIQRHINLLVKRLGQKSAKGSLDIVEWYNWCTFDIIGDLAFGESFGCLEESKTHEWIASIAGNVKAIPIINAIRRFNLDWVIPMIAPKKLLKMRQRNAQFTEGKVDQRLNYGVDRGDLWDGVMDPKGTKGGMSRQEMISNASAIVLAGSETSSTLLSGCTWLLLKNPDVLAKLKEHVRSSFTDQSEIDLISVGKLDYMAAVLDEALRLYPPVPMQSNRIVNSGGVDIAGQQVPARTTVVVQQYAACRSSENFRRPDEFLPQRWLGDPEFANDRRSTSQPFSVGPRNCIGRQLAHAEMRLILAQILWHFDLELDAPKMGARDWLREQGVWILWDKSPLWVRLIPRLLEKSG
ncbi:Fatty acid synthase beta subunit hexB [Fulvia fulva]|uniref:S-acyl fatty acid synthase thioesterase n=1 Tax=Passalora fulva TaxID=5499 RepID=A0A9Q8UWI1_PASFU|nr:Fatty acid synthase beta subunit hexB [Fulvia fulva]UJO25015.1 Fatty acid synthase beta subunit hexB [Fulvia fulva]WPV22880.1 Fatty acid synthase beta subunit hexB [Fulvia fulva]